MSDAIVRDPEHQPETEVLVGIARVLAVCAHGSAGHGRMYRQYLSEARSVLEVMRPFIHKVSAEARGTVDVDVAIDGALGKRK